MKRRHSKIFYALVAMLVFAAGFFVFVRHVQGLPMHVERAADGIVVLTGGTSRINDALQLLANGYGRRLLVTGVHPSTSRADLARLMGEKGYLVECCVDLDYEAINTAANALEAQRWASANKFQSLILVTSLYHLPRSLLETRRVMPHIAVQPLGVASPYFRIEAWWRHAASFRLLLTEYVKFIAAYLRYRAQTAFGGAP